VCTATLIFISCCPLTDPIDREAFGGSAEAKQQLKAVDTTSASDSESSTRSHLVAPPPAQILYYIKREGVRDYSPTPIDGAKPWKCLVKVLSAPLGKWLVCLGDIVTVCQGERSEGYAKVSDLRSLDDGRYMVAYTWLYTREEVIAELQTENRLPERFRKHISQRWPIDADYRYMFSTNRTVTLWDTAISKAPHEVTSKICYSSIYSTTPSTRWIWSVDNPRFRWMKRILDMDPCPRALTTVD
jgi:hypothetical protein